MAKPKWSKEQREQKAIEALQLRLRGLSFGDISDQLECAKSTAFDLYHEELDKMRPHEQYEQYRNQQLAELQQFKTRVMKRLFELDKTGEIDINKLDKLTGSIVSLQNREAKLTGIDRATDIRIEQVDSRTEQSLTEEFEELEQHIRSEIRQDILKEMNTQNDLTS